ncbi:molybdenum cofactor biosynthesis protein MoeB [Leptospira kobayashii]|uniref:Molybdenum cofactor biosynthesis protein MoeB n=1 Tax=Leptospira kobayashii TaxID=1917830 RepID=A0ABM7URD8_9LEPT|nr:HesA/MoeB/ThiF family protein [Leptospira kobayashii]BDA78674.1 molybdenum cofactor biosynthesis protein MoeB [Leptospira kobayashii]
MSPEEESFFRRQIKVPEIGILGQEKWKNSSVLIIGLGGLGCPASLYLALSGVGRLGLVDFDRVELSNLHRQTSFTQTDIGKPKTEVVSRFLKERSPWVRLETFSSYITNRTDPKLFESWDLILDCTDTISSKYAISDFCLIGSKPLVTASVFRTSAQLAVFSGEGRPCYRCLYPHLEEGDTLSCSDAGVLGVQTALAGTYQASFALRYLLKPETIPTDRIYSLEWDSPFLFESKINPDPHCISCGEKKGLSKSEKQILEISVEDYWNSKSTDTILMDVREFEETESNPIPGSILFPLSRLEKEGTPELSGYKKIICICETGVRSKQAVRFLKTNTENYSLIGGRRSLQNFLQNQNTI